MAIEDVLTTLDLSGVAGLIAAFAVLFIVIALVVYVYTSIALMTIANKTRTKNAWFAWIPIANFYLLTQIAGVSGLWTLALLAMFIPVVGSLALAGVSIWLFWRVAEKRRMPGWISLLLLIPVVNLVIIGVIAWAK